MSTYEKDVMQISEGELTELTRDLDEIHHDTLPRMHEAVDEWAEVNRQLRSGVAKIGATSSSRRTFLMGVGAAVGGLARAAGCKSKNSYTGTTGGETSTTGAGGNEALTGDLAVAAVAAALENLAVQTYQAGLDAATAGKLGAVPPAVATFVKTAQAQHKDHSAAWSSILTGAGKQAVTGVDVTVKDAVVTPGFAAVKDVPGLAKFALGLEDVAAATYLNAIQNALKDPGAIKVAASIQPVEMQHSAILRFVLGQYPVPDTFAKTDGARPPSDKIG
ncbi:MAG: ferritin-like domain-containing protein [Acidimicrobiales bacterium]